MEARISTERHVERQQKLKEQVDTRVAAAIEKKGILIVFTGNGKGKSTAAFGSVTRAVGHGETVGVAQYIKGQWGQRRIQPSPAARGLSSYYGNRFYLGDTEPASGYRRGERDLVGKQTDAG